MIIEVILQQGARPVPEGRADYWKSSSTWQQVFYLECDVRGREHTIVVTVIGDERQSIWN